jgi:hypothetical protein
MEKHVTFEQQVLVGLAKLDGTTEEIKNHLARLNGSVAEHEKRLQNLELARAATEAATQVSKKTLDRLMPLLYAVIGGALTHILPGSAKFVSDVLSTQK